MEILLKYRIMRRKSKMSFSEIYAMFAHGDTTLPKYLLDYVLKVKNDTVFQK